MGWTDTGSWQRGVYTTTKPSARLQTLLEAARMAPGQWITKIREVAS